MFFEITSDHSAGHWTAKKVDGGYFQERSQSIGKIIVPVSSSNIASIKFVEKMGFLEEARIKDAMADGDMVILTMPKERCKYLEYRYGKTSTNATGNA